jgi:hypothetical protein
VIEKYYNASHVVRRKSADAIAHMCDMTHVDKEIDKNARMWFPCPYNHMDGNGHTTSQVIDVPDKSTMYIANAAAWDHRVMWGTYGFDWDMRDWERYKENEYIPHGSVSILDPFCSSSTSTSLYV